MTPAEELDRAADLLDRLAADASPGPWGPPQRLTYPDPAGWDMLNDLTGMDEHQVFATSDFGNRNGRADLTWAEALCPERVAPHLSALLQLAAVGARGAARDPQGVPLYPTWVEHALALARQINTHAEEETG